jgi:superfamily I DNA and/or RNA helicase
MNEPLTAYPRDILYRGRYTAVYPDIRIAADPPISDDPEALLETLLLPERAAVLVTYTPPRSFTARNPIEAEIAGACVERLAACLINPKTGAVYTPDAFARRGMAVLSPHRAQNSTIRQVLASRGFGAVGRPMPLVDTVEKLQGKERDVVVVSYGVADAEYAEAEAEFLLSRNRFNVAATRARMKLIVLVSDSVLDTVPSDREVLLDAMMLKEFRAYTAGAMRQVIWRCPVTGPLPLTVQWRAL